MSRLTYGDVVQLLFHEAALLDRREYDAWLDLLDDSIVYRMPLRITRDPRSGPEIRDDMAFFEENKASLRTRVERLKTTSAWAELPPTRARHFISNILAEPVTDDGTLTVASSFLVLRSRRENADVEQIFGERRDVWRWNGERWRLFRRTIYPDQTTLSVMNLSMFL